MFLFHTPKVYKQIPKIVQGLIMKHDKNLQELYVNPAEPGAFAGVKLLKIWDIILVDVKLINSHKIKMPIVYISLLNIYSKEWCQGERFFMGYRFSRCNQHKKYNTGIQFWIIAIDVFSSYTWVQTHLDKTRQSVINGLIFFLQDGKNPQALRSDKGSEFANQWVNQFIKSKNIYYYNTQNQPKVNYAERVIRPLKTMILQVFYS